MNTLQRPGYSPGWCTLVTTTTLLSQRAEPLAIVVWDFPETPHQKRDNTDFPRPRPTTEARLRLACPPLARPNGASHNRGCWWWERPPDFGIWCGTGKGQVIHAFIHPFPLPLGVAPTTVIPGGKALHPMRMTVSINFLGAVATLVMLAIGAISSVGTSAGIYPFAE